MSGIAKVFISLLMSLCIIVFLFSGAALGAAQEIGAELLANGDFETVSGGAPEGWTAYYGPWNANYIYLEIANTHSGDYAIKVGGATVGQCVFRTVGNLVPGGKYRLSYWVYLDSPGAEKGANCIINYSEIGKSVSSTVVKTPEEWTKAQYEFQVPEGCTSVSIGFTECNDKGYALFDDASLCLTEMPAKYQLDLRDIFNYADVGTGEAVLNIDTYYFDPAEASETTVDFSIMDGSNTILSSPGIRIENGSALYSYDLSPMQCKKQYILKAIVKYRGAFQKELTHRVYKYPRPTHLRKDGVYIDNGKPFVPIIAYVPGNSYESYARLREIGINTVYIAAYSMDYVREPLEWCHSLGLKALIGFGNDGYPPAYPEMIAYVKEIISEVWDDPAVLAYSTQDEPALTPNMQKLLMDSYVLIRENDDDHPVYICQWNRDDYEGDAYKTTGKYCDILAEDQYPFGPDSTYVSVIAKKAMEAVGGRKPVYGVLQTVDIPSGYWFPTADSIREQMYRALEEGVRGIAYYSICEGEYLYNTDIWEPLRDFGANEQKLALDYFVCGKYPRFNKIDEGAPNGFYCESWQCDVDIYLVAHNRSNSAINRTVPLQSNDGKLTVNAYKAWKVSSNGAAAVSQSDTLSLDLAPQEAAFYKITLLPKSFGQYASFGGIPAGAAGYNTYGEVLDYNGTSEITIINSTVCNTGGAQDNDDAFMKLDQCSQGGANSRIAAQCKVTEGRNYVISFWSKTSAPKSLLVSIGYQLYDSTGGYLNDWINPSVHTDFVSYGTDPSTFVGSGDFYDERTPCYESYFCEGRQLFYAGNDAPGEWVLNSFEIHVPHCADAVCLQVMANGAVTDENRAVDNFTISETETNLVLNGKFDYSASSGTEAQTVKTTYTGMYPGGLAPTGWSNLNGYDSTGQFIMADNGGNTYYYASPIAGENGGDGLMGCQFQQAVTLAPGTYKLSYKRKQITDSAAPQGMVSMRYAQYTPVYANEPDRKATWMGMVDPSHSLYNVVPVSGCSLFPHVVKSQTAADGWVECEVFFEVTKAKAFWLTFGRPGETAQFAIDDVVLMPAGGINLSLGESVTVNSETITFTWAGQPEKSTWIADAAVTPAGDLTAGGFIQSALTSGGAEAAGGVLVTAVYENEQGGKSLYDIQYSGFTAPLGQVTLINSPAMRVPDGGNYTVKTFVWDSLNNITPLGHVE